MAWDFSTEPEFEEKLEWMRTFVRDEIYPLETLDLDETTFRRLTDPLKEAVKEQGLWAAHLDPELGGQGFGQVKLGLMHEILGSSIFARIFGNQAPDSGNAELIAIGATDDRRAVAVAAARRQAAQRLLDDRARDGGLRPHPPQDEGCARRRRVGDQRPQVVHVERVVGRLSSCSWRSPIPTCTPTRGRR
jgi:Acyl-CoA dehydrogenases